MSISEAASDWLLVKRVAVRRQAGEHLEGILRGEQLVRGKPERVSVGRIARVQRHLELIHVDLPAAIRVADLVSLSVSVLCRQSQCARGGRRGRGKGAFARGFC